MKKHTCFIVIILLFAALWPSYAQTVDKAAYQERFDDCTQRHHDLQSKLNALRNERDVALKELREGLYCSKCSRPKSRVERETGVSFYQHLENVKGDPVPAPPELVEREKQRYQDQIHNVEMQVDDQRLDCEKINMDYQNANKEAHAAQMRQQQQAQQDAQDEARRQVEASQQAALDEFNRQMAEREAQEERQRAAQALLDQKMAASADKARDLSEQNANARVHDDHIEDKSAIADQYSGVNTRNMEGDVFDNSPEDESAIAKGRRLAGDFFTRNFVPEGRDTEEWVNKTKSDVADDIDFFVERGKAYFQDKIMSLFTDPLEAGVEKALRITPGSIGIMSNVYHADVEIVNQLEGQIEIVGSMDMTSGDMERVEASQKEIFQRQVPQLFPGGSTLVEIKDWSDKLTEMKSKYGEWFNETRFSRLSGFKFTISN